jgi:hypothetical protein
VEYSVACVAFATDRLARRSSFARLRHRASYSMFPFRRHSFAQYRPLNTSWRALLLPAFVVVCLAPESPRGVPLLVTNTTCTPGPCQPIRIIAFPQNQPRTPGGFWSMDLGTLTGDSACLEIPPGTTFSTTDASSGRTAVVRRWTTRDSLALGALVTSEPRFKEQPTTEWFVPQRARAWRIALPGDVRPKPARPCASALNRPTVRR